MIQLRGLLMRRIVFVLAFAALISGCAFTEDSVEVKYSAPSSIATMPGAGLVTVNITPQDGRVLHRDRVASKKNGFGMETARIVSSNDVVVEVAKAVEKEIAARGFKIGQGGVKIQIETQTFYSDFKLGVFTADAVAEVAFGLTAKHQDGSIVYSHNYIAAGRNDSVMLMVGKSAAPALSEALRNAVQQMTADANLYEALIKTGNLSKDAIVSPTS
jgi:uncharacterized lipoprotein